MARGVTITQPPRIRGRRLGPSQHLEQRQRPKRRLKRGARIRNLGQIGYAKTRQLAAAHRLDNGSQHREVVTSPYRYVSIKGCDQPRPARAQLHPKPGAVVCLFAALLDGNRSG